MDIIFTARNTGIEKTYLDIYWLESSFFFSGERAKVILVEYPLAYIKMLLLIISTDYVLLTYFRVNSKVKEPN